MELKVIVYVLAGIGYLVYNLYRKLNVPPQHPDSGAIEHDPEEVKAPKYRSVEDLIREIKQQEQEVEQRVVSRKTNKDVDEVAAPEQQEQANVAVLSVPLRSKENPKIGQIKRPKHLDSIHLFDYNKKQSKRKSVNGFNLRNAIIYDAILKRPQ